MRTNASAVIAKVNRVANRHPGIIALQVRRHNVIIFNVYWFYNDLNLKRRKQGQNGDEAVYVSLCKLLILSLIGRYAGKL